MGMGKKGTTFIGVEIVRASGRLRRAFVYTALDADLKLLAICHGDIDEVLCYLGGQKSAYVAFNTPRAPNNGALNNTGVYQSMFPFELSSQKINARACEYLLRKQGFKIEFTPDKPGDCPKWMQRGFKLYRHLETFGFNAYPHQNGSHHSLETRAEAIYWRLLQNHPPLPDSLEGRLQRQLILHDHQLPVPDAMNFFLEVTRYKLMRGALPDQDILSIEELNAMAAAYIAWQAALHPDQIELLGDPEEGQIILPTIT